MEAALDLRREIGEEDDEALVVPRALAWLEVSDQVGESTCRCFGKEAENGCSAFIPKRRIYVEYEP